MASQPPEENPVEPPVVEIEPQAFVQTSPGMPVPAAAGPAYNDSPLSPATKTEPVQSTLVPAAPLGPTPPAPPPPEPPTP